MGGGRRQHRFRPRFLQAQQARAAQDRRADADRKERKDYAQALLSRQADLERLNIVLSVPIPIPRSDYCLNVLVRGPAIPDHEVGRPLVIGDDWWNKLSDPRTREFLLSQLARGQCEVMLEREGQLPRRPNRIRHRKVMIEQVIYPAEWEALVQWAKADGLAEHERKTRIMLLGLARYSDQIAEEPPASHKKLLVMARKDIYDPDAKAEVGDAYTSSSCPMVELVNSESALDRLKRPSLNSDFGFHPILMRSDSENNRFHRAGLTAGHPDPSVCTFENIDVWWYQGERIVCKDPATAWV